MPDRLVLDPHRTSLLVMDYQHGNVERMPDADALVQRVNQAIDDARAHGAHVGWVRIAFETAEFDAIPDTSVMAGLAGPDRRPTLHVDAHYTHMHHDLIPDSDDIVVRKVRVGAFTTTDLDEQLRAQGIDTVVLAGLSTSGVVLSTVREAMDRDYRIVVLRDATSDFDTDVHDFLMDRIFARFATVIDVDELAVMWPAVGVKEPRSRRG